MTTIADQLGDSETIGAQSGYFTPDGENFVPRRVARGPWGPQLSGHVLGGLLGRTLEREASDPGLQLARLTVDLLRPAALDSVQVRTRIRREGRRIRIIDGGVVQHDVVVARATGLFARRAEQPDGHVWSPPVVMPALPSEPVAGAGDHSIFVWSYGTDAEAGSPGIGIAEWRQASSPKYMWLRQIRPLIDGEDLTPLTRAAMAGDAASPLSHWGTAGLRFINADYSLTLTRLPIGPYIGLASSGHCSVDGVASGIATLFDLNGPIGHAMVIALGAADELQSARLRSSEVSQ